MAAINYAKTALKVQKVVEENGADVIFIKRSETASDPAKPWRQHDTSLTAATGEPGSTVTGKGVRDEYEVEEIQSSARTGDFKVYVSPKSIAEVDLTDYDAIELDGQVSHIVRIETIKPAAVNLLFILHVER